MWRAHWVACDQSDPAANLVGEKSINARRREIGFRSFEQHIRARACAVSPDPRIEFRLLYLHAPKPLVTQVVPLPMLVMFVMTAMVAPVVLIVTVLGVSCG